MTSDGQPGSLRQSQGLSDRPKSGPKSRDQEDHQEVLHTPSLRAGEGQEYVPKKEGEDVSKRPKGGRGIGGQLKVKEDPQGQKKQGPKCHGPDEKETTGREDPKGPEPYHEGDQGLQEGRLGKEGVLALDLGEEGNGKEEDDG